MEPELRRLLQAYISDEISDGDKIALYRLLLDEQQGDAAKAILAEFVELAPPDPNYKEEDWREIIQNILHTKPEPKIIPLYKKTWFRIAAAVLILISSGSYFLIFNKPKQEIVQTQQQRFKNDVAPGGNKAILTLSNGQQIILDSAANGLLAKQNNTNVIKTESGKLAYNLLNEKPKENEILYNTLSTPRGGQYQLTLPDGTAVWLNAASSIKYPTAFTGNERTVEITGEAYFEVKHNSKQPFKVKVGNEIIEDLGTHFNINAYTDEPIQKTTLLEGSIKISTENNSVILKPGEQSQIKNGTIKIKDDESLQEVVAWKNGQFAFAETSMEDIMRQISRWYDTDIIFDEPVPGHFVADISRQEPVSKLLKLLELTDRVHFKIEGKKITVTK